MKTMQELFLKYPTGTRLKHKADMEILEVIGYEMSDGKHYLLLRSKHTLSEKVLAERVADNYEVVK